MNSIVFKKFVLRKVAVIWVFSWILILVLLVCAEIALRAMADLLLAIVTWVAYNPCAFTKPSSIKQTEVKKY